MQHDNLTCIAAQNASPNDDNSVGLNGLLKAMTDPEWRDHCFDRRVKFPAIITYLGQFLAHDVSLFATADTQIDLNSKTRKRGIINHRTSPLMLHTLYGDGMMLDGALFTPGRVPTFRMFGLVPTTAAVEPCSDQAPVGAEEFPAFTKIIESNAEPDVLTPLLGDSRNADTPMLLWLTIALQRYHNGKALAYASENLEARREEVFAAARAQVILAWHKIVEEIVLHHVAGPDSNQQTPKFRDQDFFHGLLRALHVLPLEEYKLRRTAPRKLTALLSRSATHPRSTFLSAPDESISEVLKEWNRSWGVELSELANPAGPNLTCVTPSLVKQFGKTHILKRDAKAAQLFDVSPISDFTDLEEYTQGLLKILSDQNGKLTLPLAENTPLSFGFLAEAFYEGKGHGGLGPIGGAFLRKKVTNWIEAGSRKLVSDFDRARITRWRNEAPAGLQALFQSTTTIHREEFRWSVS